MRRWVIAAVWGFVGLWAIAVYWLAGAIPRSQADLLGFVGTILLFYPTASTEIWKWAVRNLPISGAPGAPGASRGNPDDFLRETEEAAVRALGRFSCFHALCYFAGLSLIALGFGAGWLA